MAALPPLDKLDPGTAWQPWEPTAGDPWNRKWAAHLYRRASFGASTEELARAEKRGYADTLELILKGAPDAAELVPTLHDTGRVAAARDTDGALIRGWWLYCMLQGGHSLREKLALFWHNHFATSIVKVRDANLMFRQNALFREHALGKFGPMLQAVSRDGAMLLWLDSNSNVKGKPNENYARELMELFSLGIGNYTEADIREAAKAFTGYAIKDGKGTFAAKQHDGGEKKVLGRTGKWKADDIAAICLDQPACPRFIAAKMVRFLVTENDSLTADSIDPLAEQYRKSGFDTAKLAETILRSNLFFSSAAYRQKVKSPVEFVLGIVRGLEGTPGPLHLAEAMDSLGQVLFAPPSVKGWDGGPAWLNGQTLLFRQNLALALTSTEEVRFGRRCDPAAVLARHGCSDDEAAVHFLLQVFHQGDVSAETAAGLRDYLAASKGTKYPSYWTDDDIANHRLRTLAHLTLTLPEFQLN